MNKWIAMGLMLVFLAMTIKGQAQPISGNNQKSKVQIQQIQKKIFEDQLQLLQDRHIRQKLMFEKFQQKMQQRLLKTQKVKNSMKAYFLEKKLKIMNRVQPMLNQLYKLKEAWLKDRISGNFKAATQAEFQIFQQRRQLHRFWFMRFYRRMQRWSQKKKWSSKMMSEGGHMGAMRGNWECGLGQCERMQNY